MFGAWHCLSSLHLSSSWKKMTTDTMWYGQVGETWVLKMRHSCHASLTGVRAACCPSVGVVSCATDKQYHMKPWAHWCPSDAMLMQMHSPCSHICWFVPMKNIIPEAHETAYLSLYCRSATPLGSLMPCLAQTTIPTLVASQPFFIFTSAMFTTLCAFLNHSEILEKQLLMYTSWILFLWSHKYFLKALSSTKYAHPWLRLRSLTLFETAQRQRQKLASKATNSASISL